MGSPSKPLTISIDYDGTYDANPAFWTQVVLLARMSNITVVCVTARDVLTSRIGTYAADVPLPAGMPIVYAGCVCKRRAAEKAGWDVDIWIDDMPESIVDLWSPVGR